MQTPDYADFKTLMGQLCEAYDRKHTQEVDDAYWTGLDHMSMRDFKLAHKLAAQKAGTDGHERMPKPGRFWSLRDEAVPRAHAPQHRSLPIIEISDEMCKANIALLGFMMRWPKLIQNEVLDQLVNEKARVGKQMEIIATEEEVTLDEVKRVLLPNLERMLKQHDDAAKQDQAA